MPLGGGVFVFYDRGAHFPDLRSDHPVKVKKAIPFSLNKSHHSSVSAASSVTWLWRAARPSSSRDLRTRSHLRGAQHRSGCAEEPAGA